MTLAPGQYVQITLGGLVAAAGLWVLARRRFSKAPQPLHIAGSGDTAGLSQPTQIACGLVLILVGYHLVIWTFPTWLTAVQLNRHFWYVWAAIGAVGIGASLIMDRADRKNSDSSGDAPS